MEIMSDKKMQRRRHRPPVTQKLGISEKYKEPQRKAINKKQVLGTGLLP
jgi:hypothetical protein